MFPMILKNGDRVWITIGLVSYRVNCHHTICGSKNLLDLHNIQHTKITTTEGTLKKMRAPSKATQKICTFFRKKKTLLLYGGWKKNLQHNFCFILYASLEGKKLKSYKCNMLNHVQLGRYCYFFLEAHFHPLCSCFFPTLLQNKTIAAITTSLFFCFLAPIVVTFCVPFCDI